MSQSLGTSTSAAQASESELSSRIVSIDILRGLAILWVMVFHLWGDMTLHINHPDPFATLFSNFYDRILDAKTLPSLTALGEVILGQGYLGVPLFMMLSGLSLTLNAYRRGEPAIVPGYAARFRRILPVYWGGVILIVATIGVIALLQMLLDGGGYERQWFNVRGGGGTPANVLWDDVLWALSVVPWVFRDKFNTVPVGALWFVELLLQYYLIFPFAFMLLKKIGPWWFVLFGIAITLAARAAYIPWARESVQFYHAARYFALLSPFRVSEFFIGMSIGHLLVHRREEVAMWVRSPLDILGLVVIGIALVSAGIIIGPQGDAQLIFSDVMVQIGLALVILPLIFKSPGRLEASEPARALVFLGVISFTALIVNEMMRYVADFLRFEGLHGPPWWFFLWVIYVPVGVLLAYPLAKLFGLLPQQRASERASANLTQASAPTTAERRRAKQKRRSGTAGRSA